MSATSPLPVPAFCCVQVSVARAIVDGLFFFGQNIIHTQSMLNFCLIKRHAEHMLGAIFTLSLHLCWA